MVVMQEVSNWLQCIHMDTFVNPGPVKLGGCVAPQRDTQGGLGCRGLNMGAKLNKQTRDVAGEREVVTWPHALGPGPVHRFPSDDTFFCTACGVSSPSTTSATT